MFGWLNNLKIEFLDFVYPVDSCDVFAVVDRFELEQIAETNIERERVDKLARESAVEIVRVNAAFGHTRTRFRERYGYYLRLEEYERWCKETSDSRNFVKVVNGSDLHCVRYMGKDVFVVRSDGLIRTVLPPRVEWLEVLRQQIVSSHPKNDAVMPVEVINRQAQLTAIRGKTGKASKNVGYGDLTKVKVPMNKI